MTQLLKSIMNLFSTPSQQSQLEHYITSKNPTSPAEVDYWARQYEANQAVLYWGNSR